MSKKFYKDLQKNLKNKFTREREYGLPSSVGLWFKQCDIEPHPKKLLIVCNIIGHVPYPHQEQDRKLIIKYLKKTKYKQYKKDFKC